MRAEAAVLALGLLLAGCLSAGTPPTEPLKRAALPDLFPGLTSHVELLDRLLSLEAAGVAVEDIGRSAEARGLHLLRLGRGPFELWLAARHHGNEPTSTEAVLHTLAYLLGEREPGPDAMPITRELFEHRALLLERLTFVVVPMVNPDGTERYQRRNVHGQDLNRDYLLFKEPETRAVRDAFWRVWPDAGLDLHNEGLYGAYDYDAYYPEVPRAESDTQEWSLANQWTVVHELEASGSYAGGPNENYVTGEVNDPCEVVPVSVPVPPPTDDTNPTAYCEGTHDAFLTLRGAPGWTPEAAIGWDDALAPSLPWAIRQHEATIASTAFFYARAYEACDPRVQKIEGTIGPGAAHEVLTEGPARFQLVWRADALGTDQNPLEVDLVVAAPSGEVLGPEHHPLGYTETLQGREAGLHQVAITAQPPLPIPYELRVHECAPAGAGLSVERIAGGLRASNLGREPLEVEVEESLLGALEVAVDDGTARVVEGNLDPKTIVRWTFPLAPGEARDLRYEASPGAKAGPARWHAHGPGGQVVLGVGEERGSPAPSGGG